MRTSRLLLAALFLALVAACTEGSDTLVQPDSKPSLSGSGWSGSGNSVMSDTSAFGRGSGWSGSGN
jgi:hypothetical protein